MITVHELAKQFGIPLWRIDYAIRCRGIKPIRRAGHIRLFDDAIVDELKMLESKSESNRVHAE